MAAASDMLFLFLHPLFIQSCVSRRMLGRRRRCDGRWQMVMSYQSSGSLLTALVGQLQQWTWHLVSDEPRHRPPTGSDDSRAFVFKSRLGEVRKALDLRQRERTALNLIFSVFSSSSRPLMVMWLVDVLRRGVRGETIIIVHLSSPTSPRPSSRHETWE